MLVAVHRGGVVCAVLLTKPIQFKSIKHKMYLKQTVHGTGTYYLWKD